MDLLQNFGDALGAIWSNRLRSALTMLGIIIGVASVVLMIAIGQGAQRGITSRIQSLGTNLLSVSAGRSTQTNVRSVTGQAGATKPITQDDIDAITESVTGLLGIAPELQARKQVVAGSLNTSTTIEGTSADYPLVRNATLAYGSFFTVDDVTNYAKVAVIGSEVATTLFPTGEIIGSDLRIQGSIFTVIGVLTSKGQSGFMNQDNLILIPITTMKQRITGGVSVGSLSISVADASQMTAVQNQITMVLMNSRGILKTLDQDFTVANQADAVETLNQVTQIFTLLLGGIAGISLLVGGIGVMNIMLVAVTERTREIGIRKAIGARRRDILLQFLIEATVLSLLGGAIGTAISFGGAWLVRTWVAIDAQVSFGSVLLAFLFSMCVGIIFGLLPAYKAAKLKPIQALRYE